MIYMVDSLSAFAIILSSDRRRFASHLNGPPAICAAPHPKLPSRSRKAVIPYDELTDSP